MKAYVKPTLEKRETLCKITAVYCAVSYHKC